MRGDGLIVVHVLRQFKANNFFGGRIGASDNSTAIDRNQASGHIAGDVLTNSLAKISSLFF